jgi:hypothetical protein
MKALFGGGVDHIFHSLGAFTQVSILLILILAIGLHSRWNRKVAAAGPALLTTLGIFFCFAGITWGLVDFDPANVRDSVPHLLQGIRTSFWASVFGIGCALRRHSLPQRLIRSTRCRDNTRRALSRPGARALCGGRGGAPCSAFFSVRGRAPTKETGKRFSSLFLKACSPYPKISRTRSSSAGQGQSAFGSALRRCSREILTGHLLRAFSRVSFPA